MVHPNRAGGRRDRGAIGEMPELLWSMAALEIVANMSHAFLAELILAEREHSERRYQTAQSFFDSPPASEAYLKVEQFL